MEPDASTFVFVLTAPSQQQPFWLPTVHCYRSFPFLQYLLTAWRFFHFMCSSSRNEMWRCLLYNDQLEAESSASDQSRFAQVLSQTCSENSVVENSFTLSLPFKQKLIVKASFVQGPVEAESHASDQSRFAQVLSQTCVGKQCGGEFFYTFSAIRALCPAWILCVVFCLFFSPVFGARFSACLFLVHLKGAPREAGLKM